VIGFIASTWRRAGALIAILPVLAVVPVHADTCRGYTKCPSIDYAKTMHTDLDALKLAEVIDKEEQKALRESKKTLREPALQEIALGKVAFFDKTLSVKQNEACATCHMPAAGFSGGVSLLNQTVASFPGSVLIRTANRIPPSAAYAAFAPVLHYRAKTNDFAGGNFWDLRATGETTGNPAADQAMQPFVNPVEMALPDTACAVYRVALAPYATLFTALWGNNWLSIQWPGNVDKICARAGEGGSLTRLKLSDTDRTKVATAYKNLVLAIADFEASPDVSPFTSKFDAVLAGQAQFSARESAGLSLFNTKAKCSLCHDSSGSKPLFTDFTAANIGLPANRNNPFFFESVDNGRGLVENPLGKDYVDNGLGVTLAQSSNPGWQELAPQFIGTFQVATLRNVARSPRKGFVRAYMHNGYFTDLKQIVHFYNTRDVLPRCKHGEGVAGVTCWPAPAQPDNVDHKRTGNLHLTDDEEAEIVAFLRTLSDGYKK
jgi:cytochrome c peroxidase